MSLLVCSSSSCQIDSWWYFRGYQGGVKNWTAMPSVFPNGIEAVASRTGWPIVAHNRYWSNDTDYALQVSIRGTWLYTICCVTIRAHQPLHKRHLSTAGSVCVACLCICFGPVS